MKRFLLCSVIMGLLIFNFEMCVFASEIKSTEAPVINYTLSETEDTWNPITVTLDITDDEEIVDVRYVRATNGRMAAIPDSDADFNIASASYDIDCKSLFLQQEYGITDEEFEKVFGTLRAGYIAESYYGSAFESDYNEKDELVYKDNSIPVENGKFSVCYNDNYIIYAEDKTGNKTFRIFKVINIKEASADVDLNIYSDFSGEYIAEAKLNVIENPNAPVKNIYLYKDARYFRSAGGALCDFIQRYSNLVERVQRAGCIIPAVDGVYYLRDTGKYNIIFEDAWGGFSVDSFVLSIDGTVPKLEVDYKPYDSKSSKVYINTGESSIAKIEYGEYNNKVGPTAEDEMFSYANNRTIVKDNSFVADYGKKYIVRALSTDGGAAYLVIKPEVGANENYAYEINNLSILTESGETLTATPQNKSFIAEVEVNKKTESDSKDYIFVAVYDKNGALLNIDYVKAKFAVGECSFGFNIPATRSEIGSIKAFVWSDFNSAQPLAEPKIINLN